MFSICDITIAYFLKLYHIPYSNYYSSQSFLSPIFLALLNKSSGWMSWTITIRFKEFWINQYFSIWSFKNGTTTHLLRPPSREINKRKFDFTFLKLGKQKWCLAACGDAAIFTDSTVWTDVTWCRAVWGWCSRVDELIMACPWNKYIN